MLETTFYKASIKLSPSWHLACFGLPILICNLIFYSYFFIKYPFIRHTKFIQEPKPHSKKNKKNNSYILKITKSKFIFASYFVKRFVLYLPFLPIKSDLVSPKATLPRGPIGNHHLSDFRGGASSVGGSPALGFTATAGGTLRRTPLHHSPSIPISSNYVC